MTSNERENKGQKAQAPSRDKQGRKKVGRHQGSQRGRTKGRTDRKEQGADRQEGLANSKGGNKEQNK